MISNPSGALITKGLGYPACKGLILGHFRLACFATIRVIKPTDMEAGGSIALRPGEIQNFYKPVDQDQRSVKHIKINIKFDNNKLNEREYLVRARTGKMILKAINLTNTLLNGITLIAKNISQKMKDFKISVTNLGDRGKTTHIDAKLVDPNKKPSVSATNLEKNDK